MTNTQTAMPQQVNKTPRSKRTKAGSAVPTAPSLTMGLEFLHPQFLCHGLETRIPRAPEGHFKDKVHIQF